MPYISREARDRLDQGSNPENAGELNYTISRIVDNYLLQKGEIRYEYLNEVMGALECAKLEIYRRMIVPYEDTKLAESGDIYQTMKLIR